MKKPIVVLTGPTAVGKTELSIQLAKAIGGEIISADSMQVYKHMDVGSAKITPEEMDGVRHYLVDELEPFDEFHVVKFQEYAQKYLNEIYAHEKIPIIAGGTGFYIQALLNDIDFTEQESDSAYRKELEALAEEHGNQYLHDRLKEVDPESAEVIHPNNRKRVIRALEFFQETGGKISEHNAKEQMRTSPYNFAYFVLNDERSHLYKRIDARVDKMIEDGLEAEVRRLKEMAAPKIWWQCRELAIKKCYPILMAVILWKKQFILSSGKQGISQNGRLHGLNGNGMSSGLTKMSLIIKMRQFLHT